MSLHWLDQLRQRRRDNKPEKPEKITGSAILDLYGVSATARTKTGKLYVTGKSVRTEIPIKARKQPVAKLSARELQRQAVIAEVRKEWREGKLDA